MENMLLKLARQLDSLDEASLMALWSKYANLTSRFEPSKRWEENCLVFSLIQAKHWKNQLFNYNWSQQRQPPSKDGEGFPDFVMEFGLEPEEIQPAPSQQEECEILAFKPLRKPRRKDRSEEDGK